MEQETKEIKKAELAPKILLAIVVLAGIFLAIKAVEVFIAYEGLGKNTPREIVVSASGSAFITPDIALIQLGVTTEGMDIGKITTENTDKMNKIIGEVKASGVAEKDIKTVNYSLSPKYDYVKGVSVFKGYTLSQQISVKVRDFGKIGEVMGKGTQNGANLIGNFQFMIEDENGAKQSARADAIQKAKAQAESIAQQAGITLDKVVNVYDGGYYQAPNSYSSAKAMESSGMATDVAVPDIQAGQQEVNVTVNLVYQIK
jgi:uncharacterized protein YggE